MFEENKNIGIGGFLIKKTVQPHSLRKENSNFSEFRNTNMTIYINKKFGDIRTRIGTNKLPRNMISSANLNLKTGKKIQNIQEMMNEILDEKKLIDSQRDFYTTDLNKEEKLTKVSKKILQSIKEKEYKDEFVYETEFSVNKKHVRKFPDKISAEERGFDVLNDVISEVQLNKLYHKYQMIRLKEKVDQLKSDENFNKLNPHQKIKLISQIAKKKEDVDFDEKDFFLTTICNENDLKVSNLLGIDEGFLFLKH